MTHVGYSGETLPSPSLLLLYCCNHFITNKTLQPAIIQCKRDFSVESAADTQHFSYTLLNLLALVPRFLQKWSPQNMLKPSMKLMA